MKHNRIGVPGQPHTATAEEILSECACDHPGCICHVSAHAGHGLTHCPAHDDSNPSCSISTGDRGRPVFHCHAGCAQSDILESLRNAGLWGEPPAGPGPPGRRVARPPDRTKPEFVRPYDYVDEEGKLLYQSVRYRYVENGKEGKTFKVRRPGSEPDDWIWKFPANFPRVLYRLPELRIAMAADKPTYVFYCEGEKNADSVWALGRPATTHLGGALKNEDGDGKWREGYATELIGAHVIVLEDNDPAGRKGALAVASRLAPGCAQVKILALSGLAEKGDVTDWIAAGHTLRELLEAAKAAPVFDPAAAAVGTEEEKAAPAEVSETEGPAKPIPISLPDLIETQFKDPIWAVPDLLPQGLCLLSGKPKMGKSWFALTIALSVSSGSRALDWADTEPGEILYLDVDSANPGAFKSRAIACLGSSRASSDFYYHDSWPRFGEGGETELLEWLDAHTRCRLVVIDTLGGVRRPTRPGSDVYQEDTEAMKSIRYASLQKQIALLVVTHSRKSNAEDPFDEVHGGVGITGGTDTNLALRRERGEMDAVLHRAGRFFKDDEPLAMQFVKETVQWRIQGTAKEYAVSKERREVLDALADEPDGLGPKELALRIGRSIPTVQSLLQRMFDDGQLFNSRGRYRKSEK